MTEQPITYVVEPVGAGPRHRVLELDGDTVRVVGECASRADAEALAARRAAANDRLLAREADGDQPS